MQKNLKTLGIVSISIGCVAAILCVVPGAFIFAIPVGFIGMLSSGIYVFIDTRHEINTNRVTAGIIGMGLSSMPILFMLAILILKSLNITQ